MNLRRRAAVLALLLVLGVPQPAAAQQFTVTVRSIGPDGGAGPRPYVTLTDPAGRRVGARAGDTFQVPTGTYELFGVVEDDDAHNSPRSVTAVAQLDIQVNADTVVTLDTRTARPVNVQVDGEPEARQVGRSDGVGLVFPNGVSLSTQTSGPADMRFFALPVRDPRVVYFSQSYWERPEATLLVTQPARVEVAVAVADRSRPVGTLDAAVVDGTGGVRADLHGKIVLLRAGDDVTAQVAAAADAGAAAVVFAPYDWFSHQFSEETRIPVLSAGVGFDVLLRSTRARISGNDVSPYGYQLMYTSNGELPAGRTYRANKRDLATVNHDYRATGSPGVGHAMGLPAVPANGLPAVLRHKVRMPGKRVEYVTPGQWEDNVLQGYDDFNGNIETNTTTYARGRTYDRVWYRGPFAPHPDMLPVTRDKDHLAVRFGVWSSADAMSAWNVTDAETTTLTANGTSLGTVHVPGHKQWLNLPAEPTGYELSIVGKRDWLLSNEIHATWRFRSSAADTTVSLMDIGYDLPLDDTNHADGPFSLRVNAKTVTVSAAVDGVWKPLDVVRAGDCWLVGNPGGRAGQAVSLHVTADDGAGNSVDETLTDAYLVR